MAKGKQAVAAANRRLHAAEDHIDRQTDELAEVKLRAREVEATAAMVPRLKARISTLEEDSVAQEAWATLNEMRKTMEFFGRLTKEMRVALHWFLRHIRDERGMSGVEVVEWSARKWPLLYEDGDAVMVRGKFSRTLSDEAVRSLQRTRGDRSSVDDVATIWADIDEAKEAGWSRDEMTELIQSDLDEQAAS